jgi:LysR family tcuABC transcriptional regulator
MSCVASGLGATIKPMAAVHALGDTPERWRCLRISNAKMTRTNYLYALPPQKLSPCAAAVREELRLVVRRLADSGEWQGVELCPPPPAALPVSTDPPVPVLAG